MSANTLLWLVTGCLMLQPLSTDLYLPSLPHLAPSISLLVAGRFVQAVDCCTATVVARAIIRDAHEPAEGARMIAKASSWFSLTPILGPILGGYLQVNFDWRAAFGVHTLFCALLAVAAWLWLRETHLHKNPQATRLGSLLRGYLKIAASPAFWSYTLPGSLSYGSIFAFISGSSFVLIKVLGVTTEIYGYCFAFGVTGYLAGTILCRYLLGRIGLAKTFSLGSKLSLGAGLLFLLMVNLGWHHWTVVVGCLFLTMFAHGFNFPCMQAGAAAPFPRNAGAAAGLMESMAMLMALLVSIWVGASHDGTLYPLATISAVISIALFGSAQLLARYRN